MLSSIVTSKGQTTIPKKILEHLHLKPGDRVEFITEDDGRVMVLPATLDAAELAGILKAPSKPITVGAMSRVIRNRGGRR
jgi:AbrB family looped-hinge helix DNA binding protein